MMNDDNDKQVLTVSLDSDYQATFTCYVLTTLKNNYEKDIVFNGKEKGNVVNERHKNIKEEGNLISNVQGSNQSKSIHSYDKTEYFSPSTERHSH